MAVDDFKVGEGQYALAYGKHVVAGILAGYDNSVTTAVKIKVLLGLGEWNQILEASYDGSIISTSNYTFHPGILSTGKTDSAQGVDSRFPNGIYHSRIAYYTMTLPDGMGADERPDKMRVIAETLKVPIYDEEGNQIDYIYSTNPADVFADIVRRNSEALGLDFTSRMDWLAYAEARARYANQIVIDDGEHFPENVIATNVTGSGSLAAGTYYYKVVAIKNSTTRSAASEVVVVDAAPSSHVDLSWDAVTDATDYRVYYSVDDPNAFTHYFSVGSATTSYSHTTTSGASSGVPPSLPTGDWATLTDEFQVHRAFTQAQTLTGDALSAVMFDAASEWVKDGGKYRILLPNRTAISHVLTLDNTTGDSFQFAKVPLRQKINRINVQFRNLDKTMQPDEQSPPSGNNFDAQSRVGINTEELTFGSMHTSQMRRIAGWRRKYAHEKGRRLKVTGQGDSAHVLVGDLIDVVDRQAGSRNPYGSVPNNGIIVSSILSNDLSDSANASWSDQPVPSGKSRALLISAKSGNGYANFALNNRPTVGSNASILVYVKLDPKSPPDQVAIGVLADSTGAFYGATFRPLQSSDASGFEYPVRFGMLPPIGRWTPIRIKLSDIYFPANDMIDNVKIIFGGTGNGYISEVVYFEEAPITYLVEEIEDRDSESTDDRLFTMREYYYDAYDLNDAFISPPDTGISPTPPTLDSLTFSGATNKVTGTLTDNLGTETIHIWRKLGAAGTYSEVGSIPYDVTTFDDPVTEDGTYYYKLTQDGVSGESNELSVDVVLGGGGGGGSAPSDLNGSVDCYIDDTGNHPHCVCDLSLTWTNNGATGNNLVWQRIGTGSWYLKATLASSATSYSGSAPVGYTSVTYRIQNDAVSGYSNEWTTSTGCV